MTFNEKSESMVLHSKISLGLDLARNSRSFAVLYCFVDCFQQWKSTPTATVTIIIVINRPDENTRKVIRDGIFCFQIQA